MHDDVTTGPLAWALFLGWALAGLLLPFFLFAVYGVIRAAGRGSRREEQALWLEDQKDDGRWAA